MKLQWRCVSVACLLFALPAALGAQRPAGAMRQEREQVAENGLSNVVVLELLHVPPPGTRNH